MAALRLLPLMALALLPAAAPAKVLGRDAHACVTRDGPAIQVQVTGLKDRTGELKLELYPANNADFLRDDRDLVPAGKTFHRIRLPTPASGPIVMCIRAPRRGEYALLFTHDRDGKNKFNFWTDGVGVAANRRLGRARPKVEGATVRVGHGIANVAIRAQYLRGVIPAFGFVD